ncbi:MAG: xanthine dehydrogenase family protein molybdopterin-binding subunit [Pseudomonadota bacterium]|nr:xanthine dehydrogenase family protein molybdopterin-binding subunit [Pseudomonadota bacterium]
MSFIGEGIRRREDRRFITGRGRYVDNIAFHGLTHGAVLRSPHPHARILSIDTSAAEASPGVLIVLTGEDWMREAGGDLPTIAPVNFLDGRPMNEASRPVLAYPIVKHVGDMVAFVVAETRAQALDAVDLIEVDYEELPAVASTAASLEDGAPLVHEQFGTNEIFDFSLGNREAVDAAFAKAAHITELDVVQNRITANAMEPRVYVGDYSVGREEYTLYSSTQIPHLVKSWLAEHSLRIPEHQLRVVAPDVGGGFGPRNTHYGEEVIVLWASAKLGRPVKCLTTRSESLQSDAHGRDHVTTCAMALDAEGRILGLRADTIASLGAYMTAFGPSIPAHYYPRVMSGLYPVPAIHCRVRGAYSHTVPVEAYRGAGRPEGVYVLERLLENAAREMGIDTLEIRRRNLLATEDFPFTTALGITYDCADPAGLYDKLLAMTDYEAWRKTQAETLDDEERIGIGFAGFIDCCGAPSKAAKAIGRRIGGYDTAQVRLHPTGKVTLFCGTHSHGQGHETSFCQIAADQLQIPLEDVILVEGDTGRVAEGLGTWGSRSMFLMGPAISEGTRRVLVKMRRLVAHILSVNMDEVLYENGIFRVEGKNRTMTFKEVVREAYTGHHTPEDFEIGLDETVFYDPKDRNYPSGAQMAVVKVNTRTGQVKLVEFCAVDDCGRVINPMIVEGQLHGGVAQGIGQALMEECTYDADTSQLVAGSFMDYAMPRADDLPPIRFASQETLNPTNVLGVKGSGESGSIGAPAAVANAVVDALWDKGVREIHMPMTAAKVWHAIQAGEAK